MCGDTWGHLGMLWGQMGTRGDVVRMHEDARGHLGMLWGRMGTHGDVVRTCGDTWGHVGMLWGHLGMLWGCMRMHRDTWRRAPPACCGQHPPSRALHIALRVSQGVPSLTCRCHTLLSSPTSTGPSPRSRPCLLQRTADTWRSRAEPSRALRVPVCASPCPCARARRSSPTAPPGVAELRGRSRGCFGETPWVWAPGVLLFFISRRSPNLSYSCSSETCLCCAGSGYQMGFGVICFTHEGFSIVSGFWS